MYAGNFLLGRKLKVAEIEWKNDAWVYWQTIVDMKNQNSHCFYNERESDGPFMKSDAYAKDAEAEAERSCKTSKKDSKKKTFGS